MYPQRLQSWMPYFVNFLQCQQSLIVSSENDYLLLKVLSPDGRENPFVVGFTTKDWTAGSAP